MTKPLISVDLTEFSRGAKLHVGRDWPIAVVEGFAELADGSKGDVRALTRSRFDLKSDYIPGGIHATPNSPTQKERAAHALKKYGDMNASVLVRGAKKPERELGFMVSHETGEDREPHEKYIAVPMQGIRSYKFRTLKGKVKAGWKPAKLLEHFNSTGSQYVNGTTQSRRRLGYRGKKKRLPGNAFLIESRRGDPMIVRRIVRAKRGSKQLEFLYILKPKARIKKIWGFVDGVYASVGRRYAGVITKHIRMMPDRGGAG